MPSLPWKPLLVQSVLLLLLWLLLAQGGTEAKAWVVALPTLVLAVIVSLRLRRPHRLRLRWYLLPAFLFRLLLDMFRGAVQTAGVMLNPGKRLRPGLVRIALGSSGEAERILLLNILNLVPGTLSVMLNGDTLLLHVLDRRIDVASEVVRLQGRVAALFTDGGKG